MRTRHLLAAASLALAALAAAPPALATSFREMSTEQRVERADLIIRGTVHETWTEQDERGVVWTRAQVEITRVYAGEIDSEYVIVDQLGGIHAGVRSTVEGGARFSAGEDTVLMLSRLGNGRLAPIGMGLGKFTVRLDPYTRQPIVQQTQIPYNQVYDHRFLPLPAEGSRQSLASLEALILSRVESAQ